MGHGGKRPGAGRPKGSTKKGTQIDDFNIMIRAQDHSVEMLDVILDLARNSPSENIRLSAATQILDRAHGKPGQMKLPEPDDESARLADLFSEYLNSPFMNRDAPLMGNNLPEDS